MFANWNFKRKASLTIELALLMPGIIAVMVLVLFAGYYLQDKCVIERGVYSSVLKSSEGYCFGTDSIYNIGSDVVLSNEMVKLFDKEIENRLVGKWDLSVEPTVTNKYVKLDVSGQMQIPVGIISRYVGNSVFGISISETSRRIYEPDFLRGD